VALENGQRSPRRLLAAGVQARSGSEAGVAIAFRKDPLSETPSAASLHLIDAPVHESNRRL
jgi:hypothetical protein